MNHHFSPPKWRCSVSATLFFHSLEEKKPFFSPQFTVKLFRLECFILINKEKSFATISSSETNILYQELMEFQR